MLGATVRDRSGFGYCSWHDYAVRQKRADPKDRQQYDAWLKRFHQPSELERRQMAAGIIKRPSGIHADPDVTWSFMNGGNDNGTRP